MRPFIYIFYTATIFLFCSTLLTAQSKPNGTVTGKILDKPTNQPLEYATVSVIDTQTGKTVNGSITGANGNFQVSGLPYSTYKIVIGFVGYQNITIDSVSLSSTNRTQSLGTLSLEPSQT